MRRSLILGLAVVGLALLLGCTNKKVGNPLANVGSKQPDKVLYDRAMDAMKHNRFDVARMTLQTLINTYPDSEFIARAKLSVADSWYAEGGTTALQQAEIEYKDFKTFFPNMPEAAEAQLKVANIHYQQMEKPDRDFTHAMRAEDEYRALIQEYPDSKLVPQAKQRLREVQEVLAEREFEIGRFYYLRQVYPAAIARLKTLVDRYPLYSGADDALYLLGQAYEGQIEMVRKNPRGNETVKSTITAELVKEAAEAYARIITRYPAMERAVDAKARLEALHQPVPRPTRKALEENEKEIASRQQSGVVESMLGSIEKHPDVSRAAHHGEPTMVDTEAVTAGDVVRELAVRANGGSDTGNINATVLNGKPAPNQEPPRSGAAPEAGSAPAPQNPPAANPAESASDLKPNVADSNELKPNVEQEAAPPPPLQQSNQLDSTSGASAGSVTSQKEEMADISSSKKKKKKGINKLNPF